MSVPPVTAPVWSVPGMVMMREWSGEIRATQQYIRMLMRCASEPELAAAPLRELIAGPLEAKWITYFAAYDEVHARNVALMTGDGGQVQV